MDWIRRALILSPAIAVSDQVARGLPAAAPKSFSDAPSRTTEIQRKIDEARARGGGVVELPPGKLAIFPIVLKSGVILRGAGRGATNLISIGDPAAAALTLEAGPVRYAGLQDLTFSKWEGGCLTGVDFVAQAATVGKAHGGLWWSSFRDIEILGFDCGLRLSGGGESYLLPHQFNSFERIYVKGTGATSAIQLYGQVNQIRFRDSMFELERQAANRSLPMIDIKPSLPDPAPAPKLILFDQCTFQEAGIAIRSSKVHGLSVTSSWFENDDLSIGASDTVGLVVDSCRFANAGNGGAAVHLQGATQGSVSNCVFAGAKTPAGVVVDPPARLSNANVAIWGAKL